MAEARRRIIRLLGERPEEEPFERFLLEPSGVEENKARRALRRRPSRASALVVGLELVKQGNVVLGQEDSFQPIYIVLS